MELLQNKVQKLILAIESAKKNDRNNKNYYIAGTPALTIALRELEIFLMEERKEEEQKVVNL